MAQIRRRIMATFHKTEQGYQQTLLQVFSIDLPILNQCNLEACADRPAIGRFGQNRDWWQNEPG